MTFEVTVGGRVRTVSIERTDHAGRFRVTLDGDAHVLDVARTGEYGLSILRTVPFSDGRRPENGTVSVSVALQLAPGMLPGELLVNLGGRVTTATLNGRRAGHAAGAGPHGEGGDAVSAPMPGRVVRVLAAPGEVVRAGQALVVVEAMKMENELRAPRAGRVKEILVAPGTSVEAGRILAVIE